MSESGDEFGFLECHVKYKWATTWLNQQNECALAKTQVSQAIRPVWSESSLCAQWVAKGPSFLYADTEDSDQTGRYSLIVLRSPKVFLKKSGLRRTYDPWFIQTENSNEISVELIWYCEESMKLI